VPPWAHRLFLIGVLIGFLIEVGPPYHHRRSTHHAHHRCWLSSPLLALITHSGDQSARISMLAVYEVSLGADEVTLAPVNFLVSLPTERRLKDLISLNMPMHDYGAVSIPIDQLGGKGLVREMPSIGITTVQNILDNQQAVSIQKTSGGFMVRGLVSVVWGLCSLDCQPLHLRRVYYDPAIGLL